MRRKFILALRLKRGVDMDTVIYQQDGATSYCSNASLEYLHGYFPGDKLISRRRPPLICTFSIPISFGLFSVGIPIRQGLS